MPDQTTFGNVTLDDFSVQLASAEPVPGGGSASAVAGSLGGSLLAMVAGLSAGRPRYQAYAATVERALAAGEHARSRLLKLADEDAVAYSRFVDAMRLPRGTDEEIGARQQAMSSAALGACEAPMAVVRECRALLDEIEALAGRSNLNAASDLDVAARLADAAAKGAGANVLINLPMVEDHSVVGGMTAELEGHLHEVTESVSRIREIVGGGELRDPEPA